jgi:gluconate 2-dehydrogenase gamma chain
LAANHLSRRDFLVNTAFLAKGSLLVLSAPAILTACREAIESARNKAAFTAFSNEEAVELTAIAARIIPSDDTPGATEAGVIYFLDNIFGEPQREPQLVRLRDGLRELGLQVATETGAAYFHELAEAQQDDLLAQNENTPFFATMRYLTIAGTFSLPKYGGNQNKIGYKIIGFEDRGAWAAPYGYYDADYMEKGE